MVRRLYPGRSEDVPLKGLYLAEALRETGPVVYTNFIASLDGRIALPDEFGRSSVPPAVANTRDWRLYMELLAQADVLLTTGRHLRAVTAGRQGDLLTLADEQHADLIEWRVRQGLPPHPDCVAVSETLALDGRALRERVRGRVVLLTGESAPRDRMEALREAGVEVVRVTAGGRLDGKTMIDALREAGYARIYSIAGPRVLHALLDAGVVDRLYLTLAHLALGGMRFDALTRGNVFPVPARFTLASLYLDSEAPAGAGQLFMRFDKRPV